MNIDQQTCLSSPVLQKFSGRLSSNFILHLVFNILIICYKKSILNLKMYLKLVLPFNYIAKFQDTFSDKLIFTSPIYFHFSIALC